MRTDVNIHSLQDAVRSLRETMGVTQEGLARQMNLTLRTIERYENRRPPTGNALLRLRDLAFGRERKDLARYFHRRYLQELGSRMVPGLEDVEKDEAASLIFDAVLWGLAEEFAAGTHSFRDILLDVLKPTIEDLKDGAERTATVESGAEGIRGV